jgi:Family of unknown function (DUF6079)
MPAEDSWRESVQHRRGELLAQLSSPKKRGSPQTQRQLAQTLTQLKQQYVDSYVTVHARARLGANDDSKKKKLLQDPRLARLMKLAGIDLLPRAQLVEVQNRLSGLKPCISLTKVDLDTNPVCPHCQFRPVAEPSAAGAAAAQILAAVDGDLDRMHDEWTRTLLEVWFACAMAAIRSCSS